MPTLVDSEIPPFRISWVFCRHLEGIRLSLYGIVKDHCRPVQHTVAWSATWRIKAAVLKAQHEMGLAAHEVVDNVAGCGIVAAVQEGRKVQGRGAALQLQGTGLAHAAQLPEPLPVLCQPDRVQSANGL